MRGYVPLPQLAAVLGRPMRVAMLERRSKFEEESKSLEVQHQALMRFLETLPKDSWRCDFRLAEDGGDVYRQIVSAWQGDGKHKLLTRVLDDLGKYDVVLVHRMDRFGRNALTVLQSLEQMNTAGVRVFCVEQGIDTSDPKQAFNSGLYALLAQQASDLTSERIQENKALAKRRGGWRGGSILYGYRVATTTGADGDQVPVFDKNGYKTLRIDEQRAAVIRDVVSQIVDRDCSVAGIARDLNERGVPTSRGASRAADGSVSLVAWSTTALMRILQNPGLMGYDVVGTGKDRFQILEVGGKPHRPNPPILTETAWKELQVALAKRSGKRSARSEALLTRVVYCGARCKNGQVCGKPMYGPGKITANSGSYACRTPSLPHGDPTKCSGNNISARGVENLVETVVLTIAEDAGFRRALEDAYQAAASVSDGTADQNRATLTEAVEEMAELRREAKSAKSTARRAAIATEIDLLDARIAVLEQARPAAAARNSVPRADLAKTWLTMTVGERRAIISDLIERIEIAPVKKHAPKFDHRRVTIHLRAVGEFRITGPIAAEPATCPECGKVFTKPTVLGVHRRHKHGVIGATSKKPVGQTITYQCPEPGCQMSTTAAAGLQRHVTAKHGPKLALTCRYGCETVFSTELGRASHIYQKHGRIADREPTPCGDCGEIFAGQQGVRIHSGTAHRDKT